MKYLLLLLFFGPILVYSQGYIEQGKTTTTVHYLGGYVIDTSLVVPFSDTVISPSFALSLRKIGMIIIRKADSLPYMYNGSKWLSIPIGSAKLIIDTTSIISGTSGRILFENSSNNLGEDAGLTYDASTQDLTLGGTNATINLNGITTEPTVPSSGTLIFYAKSISGRMMTKVKGASGLDFPLQPALFGNTVFMLTPNTTTSMSNIGGTITSGGTLSTFTPTATSYGLMSNFLSLAVATSPAGTGGALSPYIIGSGAVGHAGGWFSSSRCYYPDASYGTGSTGFVSFIGMTDRTLAVALAIDNPIGSRIGFAFSTNLGETNFMFSTKNNITETRTSTTIPFVAQHMYDFYSFIAPSGTTVAWRIDDLTAETTASGTTSLTLPSATTLMKYIAGIGTLTTTARNFRIKKIYVETDL